MSIAAVMGVEGGDMRHDAKARTMKISASLAVGLATLAIAVNAAAQTSKPEPVPTVVLRWDAPSECPTEDQVLDDARTLAINHNTASTSRPIAVEAVVERLAADRWRLTLAIGSAQQRVEAASCAQLARAAALFVALVMDPSRSDLPHARPSETASDEGPPATSPPVLTPGPTPHASSRSPTPPEERNARASRRELWVLAAAGFMIDAGTLPVPEALGALQIGLRYRRAEVTLEGAAGLAQDKTLDSTAGFRLRPASATLMPCYVPLVVGRLRFGPCARGEVGWMHAEGTGVSQTRVTTSAWLSLGADLAAWFAFGAHFEARLDAGVLVPVVRPNFEFTGLGSVFQAEVSVRAGTAAVIRF
jgi:hypothetical protein